jgi:SAM-dependent methyltransferase
MSGESCEACQQRFTDAEEGAGQRTVWVKNGYRILRCDRCGLLATEVPDGFDAAGIYTRDYFQGGVPDGYYDYLESEALLAREHAHRLELLRSCVASGKLLEIGCASGGFLAHAREHFMVQGLDVSAFAVESARRRGLDVLQGSLEEHGPLNSPYDLVAAFDTVEHLPRPRRTLGRAFALLRPGGYLVLTTGDAHSLLARLCGRYWRLMTPPQHLWFFAPHNLTALLTGLGFSEVSVRYRSRHVPLSLAWHQLFRGRVRPLPGMIGRRVLRLNLFDTMTVVARRPVGGEGGAAPVLPSAPVHERE